MSLFLPRIKQAMDQVCKSVIINMFKKQPSEDQELYQTIQLTAKLENNLRRFISSRKNTQTKNPYGDTSFQKSQIHSLEVEIQKLREENKELITDNEQLCRDVIHLKQQVRQQKKIISQNTKYIQYLQKYNQDLKKQLVFWMRKPLTSVTYQKQPTKDTFGSMMNQILKLKRQNQSKELQLNGIKRNLSEESKQSLQKLFFKPNFKAKQRLDTKQTQLKKDQKLKKQKTVELKKTNECTSCNFQQYSKNRSKKIFTNASFSDKKKTQKSKLCLCHKKYVETSQFLL